MSSDILIAELDRHITGQLKLASGMRAEIDRLRQRLGDVLDDLEGAFSLFESLTGSSHPERSAAGFVGRSGSRLRPRLDQVLTFLKQNRSPVTLDAVVDAMPDAPERGAVSAALHRAIKQGAVRRVRRGIYELVGQDGG